MTTKLRKAALPRVGRKLNGAHYTPADLASFVARQLADALPRPDQVGLRILDPAVGNGELLSAFLNSARKLKQPVVEGFDTDQHAVAAASVRLAREFPSVKHSVVHCNFLDIALQLRSPDLYESRPHSFYDIIIANPPYVRTQVLGAQTSRKLSHQFGLSGRIDLYHLFLIGIGAALRDGGVAGLILSNRFMTTKAGEDCRRFLRDHFDIIHIWDFGDTKLFDAAVLPCVLMLSRRRSAGIVGQTRFTSIYSAVPTTGACQVESAIAAVDYSGAVKIGVSTFYCVKHGRLDADKRGSGVWRLQTNESEAWLATIREHTYCSFRDLGKLRVGVKTTADDVFISSNWRSQHETERPELLRPLITHHVARRFRAAAPQFEILYPHVKKNGIRRAVDLADYPRARRYLEKHRARLSARSYVKAAGRLWYEIWVPQDPELWRKPKLVFRDIAVEPTFWLDFSGAVVNGDCYWLALDDGVSLDWLWLALAVANSSFIAAFYDVMFHNKLYAQRRRYMTQYVEQFPLPRVDGSCGRELQRLARRIFERTASKEGDRLLVEMDDLVWQSFGVTRQTSDGAVGSGAFG